MFPTLPRASVVLILAPALVTGAALPAHAQGVDQGTARYRVTFDATWSAQSHPGAFVASAHFSPLIGATHSGALGVWAPGGLATPGIEQMAETGATSLLTGELNAAIGAGTALERITGGGVAISPGSVDSTFTATTEHPLVSLVTMIAPSPDWFLGVHDLSLVEGGTWVDDLTVPLFAYDAGTDSGANLTSPNQDTNPQQPISLLTGGPFFGTTPLGTFRFERLDSTLVFGGNPAGSLTHVAGAPRLGETVTLALDDPTGQFGSPLPTLLALSGTAQPNFPGGLSLPGLGLGPAGTPGELLVSTSNLLVPGPLHTGAPVLTAIAIPNQVALVGADLYVQAALIDTVQLRAGLTQAVELRIGL